MKRHAIKKLWTDILVGLRIRQRAESCTVRKAMRELAYAGYTPLDQPQENGPDKWVQENVLELLRVFSAQGHSGFSAPVVVDMFKKLAMQEPLTPLTGNDDEWNYVGDDTWQNMRASHVFKTGDGAAYDIEGKIFREPSGACYTSRDSFVDIEFPYTPKREYIDVPAEGPTP